MPCNAPWRFEQPGTPDRGAFGVFDLGDEQLGHLHLVVQAPSGAMIEHLAHGEHLDDLWHPRLCQVGTLRIDSSVAKVLANSPSHSGGSVRHICNCISSIRGAGVKRLSCIAGIRSQQPHLEVRGTI